MNLFDGLQAAALGVVNNTMGYDATWTPSKGGLMQTARVLLNKPTQKAEITDEDYDALSPKMEYVDGSFPGLFESVRGNINEVVVINEISYDCFRAEKKYDGKTIIISMQQR